MAVARFGSLRAAKVVYKYGALMRVQRRIKQLGASSLFSARMAIRLTQASEKCHAAGSRQGGDSIFENALKV